MILLARIENVMKLWVIMLPHVQKPSDRHFGLWSQFPDDIIERAVVRTSRKFAPEKIDATFNPEIAWRYCAGVMANEAAAGNERKVPA